MWIRPVSSRPTEEISEDERQYRDGSEPRVLDIIAVPLATPQPRGYQSENWLLSPRQYWARVGQASPEQLPALADGPGELWVNGYSTHHGRHDRIPLDGVEGITSSLKLISVDFVQLRVFTPGEPFGSRRRRVQARFTFAGVHYALAITDPEVERRYLRREDGCYNLENGAYLTISLGEPFNGYCYKLVAAVISKR